MFVHAQALSELMYPRIPLSSAWSELVTVAVQIAIVLAFALSVVRSRSLAALLVFSALVLVFWVMVFFIQIDANNQHLLTSGLWGIGFLALTLIPLEWSQARAQSRARAKILARYVSTPVLRDLLKEQNFDPLIPRSAEITVLVADMVSYSQTVAEQPLDGAATMTKEFLEAITEPIWSLRGTLDRYTGDGLIAFWGAPISVPNHAELAIKAAAHMLTRIEELNQRNSHRGLPHVQVRIGIASGSAMVGDFGTDMRASYTAVGTCINMASRLEAAAKNLGFSTIISESTAKAVSGEDVVLLGEHEIRGLGRLRLFTLNDSLAR
jgi:adenylate cyclase